MFNRLPAEKRGGRLRLGIAVQAVKHCGSDGVESRQLLATITRAAGLAGGEALLHVKHMQHGAQVDQEVDQGVEMGADVRQVNCGRMFGEDELAPQDHPPAACPRLCGLAGVIGDCSP